MNPSSRRVLHIGLAYFGATALVAGYLGYLMTGQHEEWLMRSYGNRWAFRDVPTKRGAIRDRTGRIMVRDRPTSTLEVYYREFRRRHPCGIAVHCVDTAARLVPGTGTYTYSKDGVLASFRHCLYLPLSLLRDADAGEEETVGDLRFYLVSLFATLTDGASFRGRYRRLSSTLRRRLELPDDDSICAALDLDPEALEQVFRARVDELEVVAQALTRAGKDFWGELGITRRDYDEVLRLERQRELGQVETLSSSGDAADGGVEPPSRRLRSERVPFALHRRLPYDVARSISTRKEWHPGLIVRPSVDREIATADAMAGGRFDSLPPLLGRVSYEWAEDADRERRRGILDSVRPEIESVASADPDLSAEQRDAVRESLTRALSATLAGRGRVGRYGVEADSDPELRGIAGMQWVLRSRGAREVGLWSSFDVTPGRDVYLTVDLRLQALMEAAIDEAVAATSQAFIAAFTVIDANTGDILAVASRPTRAQRSAAQRYKLEPALSWWTAGHIGSLAKPMVLLEHLDALRHARPAQHHSEFAACHGRTFMPDRQGFRRFRLRCDHEHGDRVHDCVVALGESCNSFFFQAAEGLGWPGIERAYGRFGLFKAGAAPGNAVIPYPAAFQDHVPGIPRRVYPDPAWALERPDLQRRAIGYGIAANVLQIARAYAGLATGRLPELSLVRRQPEQLRHVDLGVDPADLATVQQGMQHCVERGSARKLDLEGVHAKTGTAEIDAKTGINNAWFAGYIGANRPRLAFACVLYRVPEGSYGAAVAGPMVKRFLERLRDDPELALEYLER